MLCSVSNGKSGSSWLDRLRSSKGFPAGDDDLTLDHFLNNQNPNSSNFSNSSLSGSLTSNIDPKSNSSSTQSQSVPQPTQPAETSTETGGKEWFGIMTNVLSELFNMGDSAENLTFSRKKSSRKQRNPKMCLLPSPLSVERRDAGAVAVAVAVIAPTRNNDTHLMENKDLVVSDVKLKTEGNGECVDGEGDKCNNGGDLLGLGYSRTEVTIIDSSCVSSWKFEKLLFRKKNVWKVRDKKGKSRNVGRKKRKSSSSNGIVCGEKKAKHSISPFDSSNVENGEALIEGRTPQNDKRDETFKVTPYILGQVPEKRFQFPRSARNSTKGGASGNRTKDPCEANKIAYDMPIKKRRNEITLRTQ